MLCDWCDGVIFEREKYEVRDGCRICAMCLCEEEPQEDEEGDRRPASGDAEGRRDRAAPREGRHGRRPQCGRPEGAADCP